MILLHFNFTAKITLIFKTTKLKANKMTFFYTYALIYSKYKLFAPENFVDIFFLSNFAS